MNLATDYLGLRLGSPFVVGASPFCDSVHHAQRLQDAGAGALVMRSLFEEQIEPPRRLRSGGGSTGPDEGFPEFAEYQVSLEGYVRQLAALKGSVSVPVIASLNGDRPGRWTDFARRLERAGADAIELNFYRIVANTTIAADQVETEMLETVGLVAGAVKIPVAVKLSPYYTSLAQLAVALELAGAAGLVVFNRFYEPGVDVNSLDVQPSVWLSDASETLLRLHWLAILSPQLRGSLAATGGFHSAEDAIKALLSGAHVVQVVSVLLRHGAPILRTLVQGVGKWMSEHGYENLADFRGKLSMRAAQDASAVERANYIRTLQSWKL